MSAFNPFAYIEGAQQASKEYREGRALDDILRQAKQTQDPYQMNDIMGQVLQRLPQEKQQAAMQYLQNRQQNMQSLGAREEAFREGGVPSPSRGQPRQMPSQQERKGAFPQDQKVSVSETVTPQGESIKVQDDFLSGTTPSVNELTAKLMLENPVRYRDPAVAQAEAEKRIAREQEILTNTETEYNKAFNTLLGPDSSQKFPGEVKRELLKEALKEAKTGKISEKEAAEKAAKKALKLDKSTTLLGDITSPAWFGKSAKESQRQFNTIRKSFEDLGQQELFKNYLMDKDKQHLSNGVASFVAFPPSNNPKIASYLKDTKRKFTSFQRVRTKGKGNKSRSIDDIVDFISENLGPNDSLNALFTAFNGLGYDGEAIRAGVENSPKIRLNERQQREFEQRPTFRPTLNDIYFFSSTGLDIGDIVNE